MKTLITTLLAILFSFQVSAQNQLKNFRITVNMHHPGGSFITTITQDSIVSTHYLITSYWMNLKQGMNGYPNVVTEAIGKIDLEKLADNYYSKGDWSVDDYYEFDFTFEINGKTGKTHIYGGRQEQILEFVKQINEMIPSCFQIPYNEEYLKKWEPKYPPFRLNIIDKTNWAVKIDSIAAKDFQEDVNVRHGYKKINGDSLLKVFAGKYSTTITLSDSCCILKGFDKELKYCRTHTQSERLWRGYDARASENGYLILEDWGYETGGFTCFDPKTKKYFISSSEPKFIDSKIIYSCGNDSGEGVFQIANLKTDKYFGFVTFNWELTGFYRQGHSIYLRFKSRYYHSDIKYLKLSF